MNFIIVRASFRVVEISQRFRAYVALAEDLSLVPSTHIEELTALPVSCAPGHSTPSAGLH